MPTTGRTLDENGRPIPGTGFAFDPDGDLAALLAKRTGALTSHPARGAWSAPLPAPDEGDVLRAVGVYRPGFDGPPEHYHERSPERFEVLAGEATFRIDGRAERVVAGESLAVEPGERHTFTVGGDDLCYMVVDVRSPGRLAQMLPTLAGLAHDDRRDAGNLLQRAAVADRLDGNTEFTELPPAVWRPLRSALAPVARLRGYRGAYEKYTRDAFWERHVEQPDL